jgi:hypothetical protein
VGVSRDLRVFIGDGPRGGQYTRVAAGLDGSPPERIRLRNPLAPGGKAEDGSTGHMPTLRSVYILAGRLDDGTPMYRMVRDS